MKRSFVTLLTFVAAFALTAPARAERIYRLVDYPTLQNGHTLTGTITTSDDAPADGLLSTAEILDWQWSITESNNLSASYAPPIPGLPTTFAQGIAITPTSIEMPRVANVSMRLEEAADGDLALFAPALRWFTYFNNVKGYYSFRSLAPVACRREIVVGLKTQGEYRIAHRD